MTPTQVAETSSSSVVLVLADLPDGFVEALLCPKEKLTLDKLAFLMRYLEGLILDIVMRIDNAEIITLSKHKQLLNVLCSVEQHKGLLQYGALLVEEDTKKRVGAGCCNGG